MNENTIQLPNPSQHIPIYLQQFPNYSNRKCKKSPFSRTAAHIFVSPGDAPAIITQYVALMERQFNACQTPRSMCPSIFNSFPVIRTAIAKKIAVFTYRSPHICFPWRLPCDYHAMCCMDGKTIQCLPNPSQHVGYLSIFNSFRVIRCLSQCVSPKIAIFTKFGFPWGRPWGNHVECCMDGKKSRCLQIVSLHVPI